MESHWLRNAADDASTCALRTRGSGVSLCFALARFLPPIPGGGDRVAMYTTRCTTLVRARAFGELCAPRYATKR